MRPLIVIGSGVSSSQANAFADRQLYWKTASKSAWAWQTSVAGRSPNLALDS